MTTTTKAPPTTAPPDDSPAKLTEAEIATRILPLLHEVEMVAEAVDRGIGKQSSESSYAAVSRLLDWCHGTVREIQGLLVEQENFHGGIRGRLQEWLLYDLPALDLALTAASGDPGARRVLWYGDHGGVAAACLEIFAGRAIEWCEAAKEASDV